MCYLQVRRFLSQVLIISISQQTSYWADPTFQMLPFRFGLFGSWLKLIFYLPFLLAFDCFCFCFDTAALSISPKNVSDELSSIQTDLNFWISSLLATNISVNIFNQIYTNNFFWFDTNIFSFIFHGGKMKRCFQLKINTNMPCRWIT